MTTFQIVCACILCSIFFFVSGYGISLWRIEILKSKISNLKNVLDKYMEHMQKERDFNNELVELINKIYAMRPKDDKD